MENYVVCHSYLFALWKTLIFDIILVSEEGELMEQNETSLSALWQSVLAEVKLDKAVSDMSFKLFWQDNSAIKLTRLDGDTYYFEVKNFMYKTQFETKFYDIIVTRLAKLNPAVNKPKLVFSIHKGGNKKSADQEEVVVISDDIASRPTKSVTRFESHLNSRYTFDNFIVGSCNQFAYTAAQAAAKHPGEHYNPVFVYGGVGLGKTHLIQAIGNAIYHDDHSRKVLYATTEEFVNDFIYHVRNKTPEAFTRKYRELDALIIDDIQFIAGKGKTEEAFFNTFNALHQANRQIVISSDRPPAEIPTLTDRLRSRFQMGMMVDVNLPEYETRVAIIEAKAALNNTIELPRDTAEYIAKTVRTNVRELEGALNQVMAYAEMQNNTPTVEFAAAILSSARPSPSRHLTSRQVVDKTARFFEIKVSEIKSSSRSANIALPRQIAMYLLRSELHLSYPQIAHELGRNDHTTAMHSIQKIETQIKLDVEIRNKVAAIKEELYA